MLAFGQIGKKGMKRRMTHGIKSVTSNRSADVFGWVSRAEEVRAEVASSSVPQSDQL